MIEMIAPCDLASLVYGDDRLEAVILTSLDLPARTRRRVEVTGFFPDIPALTGRAFWDTDPESRHRTRLTTVTVYWNGEHWRDWPLSPVIDYCPALDTLSVTWKITELE